MTAAKRLTALVLVIAAALAAYILLRPPAAGDLLLSGASAAILEEDGTVAVFLTIENGGAPDRLTAVASPDAAEAEIVGPDAGGLAIPAGASPALAPDGAYLRLSGVEGDLREGRLIPVTITFERAGPVSTQARLEGQREHGEGVDVGGTFTDLVLIEPGTGRGAPRQDAEHARQSGPRRADGARHGRDRRGGAGADRAWHDRHDQRGAGARLSKTGLITTQGFRDVLELGRRTRPQPYGMKGVCAPSCRATCASRCPSGWTRRAAR
jgi:copper(I)-binding protein